MAKRKKTKSKRNNFAITPKRVFFVSIPLLLLSVAGLFHFVYANEQLPPVFMDIDPNIGLEQYVTEYFTANGAPEMVPIIRCESNFRQFEEDGTPLKNREGSSATGIAQIIASKHPDPKVLKRLNRRYNTDLTAEDFDINTLEGNLGYALALYKVRGTRDWECAHKLGL